MFVTKSRMLAKKVEQDFISFIRSDALSAHAPQHFVDRAKQYKLQDKKTLFSSEQTGNWHSDLPQRFSDLRDAHFPLFLTFEDVSYVIHIALSTTNSARSFAECSSATCSLSRKKQSAKGLPVDQRRRNTRPHIFSRKNSLTSTISYPITGTISRENRLEPSVCKPATIR
jgi:hypothetical protein